MSIKRSLFHRRTAESDSGGIIGGGAFVVKLGNFKLVYQEGDHALQIPVELLQGKSVDYDIGVNLIRQWDEPLETLSKDQALAVAANIFAALDYMRIRY